MTKMLGYQDGPHDRIGTGHQAFAALGRDGIHVTCAVRFGVRTLVRGLMRGLGFLAAKTANDNHHHVI